MTNFKDLANKRSLVIVSLFIAAGLVGFSVVYAMSKNTDSNEQTNCEGTCVALYKDRADPDTVTVPVGTYVQFNSADGKAHSLSLGEGGGEHDHTGKFNSGKFQADEGWRVEFKDEGTFYFHDHLNPKINVLVVVYTPGKDYKL